ncbi:MAG: YcxB family protein [Usitatibacteraceae bacterium]
MHIKGTILERDYVSAQFLHLRPSRAVAILGALLVLLFAWTFVIAPSPIMFGACTYFVCFFLFYIPWRAKRNYHQYKMLSETVSIDVREDGLFFKRQNGEGLVPWNQIHKWRSNKTLLLLYPASNIFHLVPSHFFAGPEEFAVFVDTVEGRLGKAS